MSAWETVSDACARCGAQLGGFDGPRLCSDCRQQSEPAGPSPVSGVRVEPAVCLDCGLDYADFPMDMILPRPQWLTIHPAEGGLLCASCIVKRAAKVPGATCIHAIIEIAPHQGGPAAVSEAPQETDVLDLKDAKVLAREMRRTIERGDGPKAVITFDALDVVEKLIAEVERARRRGAPPAP